MTGYTLTDLIEDKENHLSLIKEGEPVTIADIPPEVQSVWREAMRLIPYPPIQEIFRKTLTQ